MTKALLVATALGLSVAGANACEFERSAGTKIDKMSVASTGTTQSMSAPGTKAPMDSERTDQVKDDAVLADEQG
jgi:hypothetical protein